MDVYLFNVVRNEHVPQFSKSTIVLVMLMPMPWKAILMTKLNCSCNQSCKKLNVVALYITKSWIAIVNKVVASQDVVV